MVQCIGFENRRSFTVTEGSNPSLSEFDRITLTSVKLVFSIVQPGNPQGKERFAWFINTKVNKSFI